MGGGGAGSIKSHKLSQNSGDCSQKERSVGCQKRGKILKSNSQFVLMKQIFGHFFTSTHGKHLFWMEGRFVGLSIGRRKFCGRSFHPFLLHGSAETPTLQWVFSLIQLKTQHCGGFVHSPRIVFHNFMTGHYCQRQREVELKICRDNAALRESYLHI